MASDITTSQSSRRVQVDVGGAVVADSTRAVELHEGTLPVRYYLPMDDVDGTHLTPTATSSVCPYKGTASYWSVTVGDRTFPDVVWSYADPIPEAAAIAGLVCFWAEKPGVTLTLLDA
jgi:uncharacterized protein (DUF427 family)